MVEKFKEIEIDPIGFGSFVRSKDRNFDYAKWQEENYQNMQVNVKAKVEIGELGTIE